MFIIVSLGVLYSIYLQRELQSFKRNLCNLDKLCDDANDDVQELDCNLSEYTAISLTSVIDNSLFADLSMINTELNNSAGTTTGQIQKKLKHITGGKKL